MSSILFLVIVGLHFFISLFLHSFFLHRYGTHRQFSMSKKAERVFFILTWFFQGSSFLHPATYAKMHLEHHAHSDTKDDPHSPVNFSILKYGLDFPYASVRMMLKAKKVFEEIREGKSAISSMYRDRTFPEWKTFEKFAVSNVSGLLMGLLVVLFYYFFAHGWLWILLPISILNAPIQGGIVNWCGHMWGYRNYNLSDNSKNTWVLAPIMWGELYQNNHHQYPQSPNFGGPRWFEIDPLYPVILLFDKVKIIKIIK